MKKEELYRLNNIVFSREEEERGTLDDGQPYVVSSLVIERSTGDLQIRISEMQHTYPMWMSFVNELANPEKLDDGNAKILNAALEATCVMMLNIAGSGVHDVKLTNDLCDAMYAYQKRIGDLVESMTSKSEEAKEAEEWMERQDVLDEMAKEAEEEKKE